MRKLIILGSAGGVALLGGAVAATIAATPGSADAFGSCALSGSGPAPSCSYQLSDGDLSVRFTAAGATRSTLNCTLSESGVVGAVRLSAGESGSVNVNNLAAGVHRYGVRCATIRGGSGGVSRSGGFTVSVQPRSIISPTTPTHRPPPIERHSPTHRPPSIRRSPEREGPTRTSPTETAQPPTTTTTTTTAVPATP